jgi:hypothetical protein
VLSSSRPPFGCRHPGAGGAAAQTPGPSGAAAERRRPRPRTTFGVRDRVALTRAAGSSGLAPADAGARRRMTTAGESPAPRGSHPLERGGTVPPRVAPEPPLKTAVVILRREATGEPSGAAAERRRGRLRTGVDPRCSRQGRAHARRWVLRSAPRRRGSPKDDDSGKVRGVCAKPSYGRCPNPSPINPLPFSARNLPAPPPTSAIIPGSRRTGARSAGDPQRRRERKERAQPEAGSLSGVAGRGDARSSRVESRTAEGGGVDTRTGPGDGRCHPCPPCAEGPLVNSEAHSPRMWKPVRAERQPSSKRYFSEFNRAKARRSANVPITACRTPAGGASARARRPI